MYSAHKQAEIYVSRLEIYNNLGKFAEGVAVGIEGLQLFGVTFPVAEEERGQAIGAALMAIGPTWAAGRSKICSTRRP